jgi:hypothetical protein
MPPIKPSDPPSVEEAEAALRKYQQEHDEPHYYRMDEETGVVVHWSTAEGILRKALVAARARAAARSTSKE